MITDPFQVLGIPKDLVAFEYAQHRPREDTAVRLKMLVESSFRGLSKLYHPDAGGDAEIFGRLSEARQEILDDPMMVADFFVGDAGVRTVRQHERAAQDAAKQILRASAPLNLLRNIDPAKVAPWLVNHEAVFKVGYEESLTTSLLVASIQHDATVLERTMGSRRIVSKVLESSDKGWILMTLEDENELKLQKMTARQLKKALEARSLQDDPIVNPVEVPVPLGATQSLDAVLVGAVSYSNLKQHIKRTTPTMGATFSIGAGSSEPTLSWEPYHQSWWAEHLMPTASQDDCLVFGRFEGKEPLFALAGPKLALRTLS